MRACALVVARFAHPWRPCRFEVDEDVQFSAPATVGLADLFADWTITSATEMTLPGSQPLANAPKWTYGVEGCVPNTLPVVPPAPAGPGLEVTLGPMEIRTFVVDIVARSGPAKPAV